MTTEINGNVQSFFAEMHSFLQEVQDLGRTNHAETTTEVPSIAIHHSFFHGHQLRRILADIGREHSEAFVGLVPSVRSSIISELNTALGIIKHESLRNLDVAVR